ncbi:MAG: nickel insertion protein, partial [Gemmatimonadota bacterium]|nr:nickel insertion protein [Gemmatimonadota bacterium]
MKTAYFDMFSGVSGDMILGAMVDCGLPKSVIEETVAALGLESVEIKVEKGQSNSITATRLQ